jgi:hypothetical protein
MPGKPEEAVLEYPETIRPKPDYSAAHRGLGRALEKAGRLAEAEAGYTAGLDLTARTGDLDEKRNRGLRAPPGEARRLIQAQPVRGVPRAFLGTSVHANVAGCCWY